MKLTTKQKKQKDVYEFSCTKCSAIFANKQSWQRHVDRHKGVKFSCKKCDSSFTRADTLKQHFILKHSDIKKLKCPKCSFLTYRESCFKSHLKEIHERKENIFVCPYCKDIFKRRENLIKHLTRHSGVVSKVTCELCGKKLRDPKGLRKHKKQVHLPQSYTCEYCSKKFADSGNLTRHIRVHTKEKPFKCCFCNHAANTHSIIMFHIKTIHDRTDLTYKDTLKLRGLYQDPRDTMSTSELEKVQIRGKKIADAVETNLHGRGLDTPLENLIKCIKDNKGANQEQEVLKARNKKERKRDQKPSGSCGIQKESIHVDSKNLDSTSVVELNPFLSSVYYTIMDKAGPETVEIKPESSRSSGETSTVSQVEELDDTLPTSVWNSTAFLLPFSEENSIGEENIDVKPDNEPDYIDSSGTIFNGTVGSTSQGTTIIDTGPNTVYVISGSFKEPVNSYSSDVGIAVNAQAVSDHSTEVARSGEAFDTVNHVVYQDCEDRDHGLTGEDVIISQANGAKDNEGGTSAFEIALAESEDLYEGGGILYPVDGCQNLGVKVEGILPVECAKAFDTVDHHGDFALAISEGILDSTQAKENCDNSSVTHRSVCIGTDSEGPGGSDTLMTDTSATQVNDPQQNFLQPSDEFSADDCDVVSDIDLSSCQVSIFDDPTSAEKTEIICQSEDSDEPKVIPLSLRDLEPYFATEESPSISKDSSGGAGYKVFKIVTRPKRGTGKKET